MGSWVKLDTAPYHHPEVAVDLPGGQMCMHLIIFSFLCEQAFLIAFHLRLQLRFLMRQCGTTCFCIYCTKNTSKLLALFESIF